MPVEGIIAFDAEKSVEAFAKNSDRLAPRMPFVSMGAYWAHEKSYVGIDLRSGAEAAMDHLLGTGRRHVAFMAPANSGLLLRGARAESYQERMRDSGLPTRVLAAEGVRMDSVMQTLSDAIATDPKLDAILCMNDDLAIYTVFALQKMGIRPGLDIAVVGFDGIDEAEQCPCPITTVSQPASQMCSLAIEFLNAQMEDPSAEPQQIVLQPTLVIRSSSMA